LKKKKTKQQFVWPKFVAQLLPLFTTMKVNGQTRTAQLQLGFIKSVTYSELFSDVHLKH